MRLHKRRVMLTRPVDPRLAHLGEDACALALAQRWGEADAAFRELMAGGDRRPAVRAAWATCLMALGREREAIAEFRRALKGDPRHLQARNNLIFLLDLQPETTPAMAWLERRRWWQIHGAPLAAEMKPHDNDPDPDRPLRVGYVSGDFCRHSAAFGFGPVVLRHTAAVAPFCYSMVPPEGEDTVTQAFRRTTTFRPAADVDFRGLADLIREDRIDLLVDLSGHSGRNQLQVFCLKPAPVQVHAWGYAAGSGLDTMDVMFADPVALPDAQRQYFRERIVDLPSIIPYAGAPDESQPIAPAPDPTRPVIFGSLNRAPKLNEGVLDTWAAILREVPESRLILKDASYERPETTARVRDRLAAGRVTPDRVDCRGYTRQDLHLTTYAEIDLALDPFPQGGGISALEGLWMGVPMVTLLGERLAQRIGGSFLTALGLTDFITTTRAEYVARAVEWATRRRSELADLRAGLRDRLMRSPINAGYVKAVEAAYRDLWRGWCARHAKGD